MVQNSPSEPNARENVDLIEAITNALNATGIPAAAASGVNFNVGDIVAAFVVALRQVGLARPSASNNDATDDQRRNAEAARAHRRNAAINLFFEMPLPAPASDANTTHDAHSPDMIDVESDGESDYDAILPISGLSLDDNVNQAAPNAFVPLGAVPVNAGVVGPAPVEVPISAAPIAMATTCPVEAAPAEAALVDAAPAAVASAPACVEQIPGAVSGFVCAGCKAYNLVRPACETWYVVSKGLQVGAFQGWENVSPLVTGVRLAVYKKYKSKEAAEAAFQFALDAGNVVVLKK